MKKTILIILTVVVVAGISGGGVYLWQKNTEKKEKNKLEKELELLKKQEAQLNSVDQQKKEEESLWKSEPLDKRILLTPQNIDQYNVRSSASCDEKFNNDAPSTTVNYKSEKFGISIDVPYNPKWGSNRFKLNPYDFSNIEISGSISFGSMGAFEACSWVRQYDIGFYPPIDVDSMIKKIKEGSGYPDLFPVLPTKEKINGLDVVKYEVNGLCSYSIIEVIGKKFNYRFSPTCGDSFTVFEDMIKSMKLID